MSAVVQTLRAQLACANADAGRLRIKLAAAVAALGPFAKITPSSLYPDNGGDADKYSVELAAGRPDFTGADLARARTVLKSLQKEVSRI